MMNKSFSDGALPPVALVLQDGGMCNAFTLGFLSGAEIRSDAVDAVFAPLSAAVASMFFMTGQLPEAERLWAETLVSHPAFSWQHSRDTHQPAKMNGLIDRCHDALSPNRWQSCQTALHVPVARGRDGQLAYLRSGETELKTLVEGALEPERLLRAGSLSGDRLLDGELNAGKCLYDAARLGYTRYLLVLLFPDVYPHLRTDFSKNLYVARPKDALAAKRFSRSRDEVRRTIEAGRALGREVKDEIRAFLAPGADYDSRPGGVTSES